MAMKSEILAMYQQQDFAARYKIAEQVTGPFAQALVDMSGVAEPTQKPLAIFDNACGTGIISSVLRQKVDTDYQKSWKLTCGDFSEAMVEFTKLAIEAEGWANAEAKIVNAQDTGLPSGEFTHVFAGFAFTTFPDPKAAVKECFRVLQPGGIVSSSTWQSTNWIEIAKTVVERMPPGDLRFPSVKEFLAIFNEGWDSESYVRSQFEQEGFEDVNTTTVDKYLSVTIPEFMELIRPILGAGMGKFWTQAQREEHEKDVIPAIRRYLEETYGADGLVPLEPVAVLATARKPW
ncbi:putative UbiE/COQ5 family methyltransferase [Aspergillus steynii IBT 23096]|uniref:Putative UbiE/COQ5 family methyltransferase n=1 Tax=Aspergillus steynii IBT 23096 TaxID=1392250 RepID=A0A2I2G523_9EURO|nr:putative UbiE/COQ5 family methyltransferase [Aspergillus steynii IBT 23096]PLB47978.1 putative UbiE/COQ5 family methyltransferase [Aspergillus steynii IBT 23096]